MAAQQPSNNDTMMFQVGRMASPVHIVSYGSSFDDPQKNTCSASVMVVDAETLGEIHRLELEVSTAYPNMELKSCIGEIVEHPENGSIGHPMRVKLTTNKRCYRAHAKGAPRSLDELRAGHTVVLQCRSLAWTYKDQTCGITVYGNLVRGCGEASSLWASPAQASSAVVWA